MSPQRLFRTPDAVADLDSLWDHIARDSPSTADRILDELNKRFELMLRFPQIGELQPHLADGNYRRSVHRNYVIYYRPIEQGIVIARVFHGAQDHERQL